MENAKCYAPQILVGTEGLPREQWLEYRRKGIGGSDAAAVLGISPFRTGRDLYYDKLNIVTADDAENWVQLEVGTLLEPLVAKIFAHKTGYKIYRRPFMFRHPQYPWMLADLDYMVELPDVHQPSLRSRPRTIMPRITGGTTARKSFLSTMNRRGGTTWRS